MEKKKFEFSFSSDEWETLKELLPKDVSSIRPISSERVPPSRVVLQLSISEAENLRDLLTELLAKEGFDSGYSPNTKGKKIESLIDKLYIS